MYSPLRIFIRSTSHNFFLISIPNFISGTLDINDTCFLKSLNLNCFKVVDTVLLH